MPYDTVDSVGFLRKKWLKIVTMTHHSDEIEMLTISVINTAIKIALKHFWFNLISFNGLIIMCFSAILIIIIRQFHI